MKKILTTLLIVVLWSNTIYANIKNIGNGLTINIPDGYFYFDITLKQIVSRFPSISVSDFTNSEAGIGKSAKIIVLANNRKTIDFLEDISTVTGLAKLKKNYLEPLEDLSNNLEFEELVENYMKKKYPELYTIIDSGDATEEDWFIFFGTIIGDKKFLKTIDKYIHPFIDRFNSEYEFDKNTIIFIADKKIKNMNELKKISVTEARSMARELLKVMIKEDRSLNIYKNWKYEIGENPKGNLYLYSNDIDYLNKTPLWKNWKYLKASDLILTTENGKLFLAGSQCYKKCSSTDFLEIIGPTNLYKVFANNQIKTPITKNNSDIVSQLKKLNDLYKSGSLTKDEFNKAKKKLLN